MKITDITPKPDLKIRRKNWREDYYWYFKHDDYFKELALINKNGNMARICKSDLLVDNWEIFKKISLEKLSKKYAEFKYSHVRQEPNTIILNRKDLRELNNETKNELDWSYKPNQLFGMKIVINNSLMNGCFELKYVEEIETLNDKVETNTLMGSCCKTIEIKQCFEDIKEEIYNMKTLGYITRENECDLKQIINKIVGKMLI